MGHTFRASILLVEDNEDIREGLSTLLEAEQYDVSAFSSAEEALIRLEKQRFDLIITDYMLPGESGGWMVEQAAARGCLSGARVLMITAHPRVVPPPGVRILHKPLDIHVFLRVVGEELAAGHGQAARVG
ncbi:response regulator [Hyalangium versicolor]|uniref:response regulator n=1 Tax=Hyalangium versicolor TaxID=2861190 RepID=UPI001CCBAC42|nr:response regulator [Hyalangium versicolor]